MHAEPLRQHSDAVARDDIRLDHGAIVADPAMASLYDLIHRLAASDLSILIVGETGVGKEKAARALHGASARAGGPFVAINCAAIPDPLVESELFGHERGAFSGAERAKPGMIERAAGGTLFLDEICELPPQAQAKLLRAIEERQVFRVGAVVPIPVDFRLVAATNRDVPQEVTTGRFREDLYYRIAAAVIALPPLRERPLDIPVLARAFLSRACSRLGRTPMTISAEAMRALAEYRFPGNVRELLNVMEYVAATCSESVLERRALPRPIAEGTSAPSDVPPAREPRSRETPAFRPICEEIEELERRRMKEALAAAGGNQTRAAALIAMPRRTFVSKLRRYGIRSG